MVVVLGGSNGVNIDEMRSSVPQALFIKLKARQKV